MPDSCKTCRFWRPVKTKETVLDTRGMFVRPEWRVVEYVLCTRFPKHEFTSEEHFCGEHQPIPAEPQNVTTTGDIRHA